MQNDSLPVEYSRGLLHRANQAFFFVGGFGTASWAPLVPLLKARLDVAEDVLGLLLLCIGIGSLLTMPIAGFLAGRFGCRRVLAVDSVVFAALLILLAVVGDIHFAVPALLALGAAMGILDVTVNIHAVRVEQLLKKRLMSGMHALWSMGGFLGAGLFTVWHSLGLTALGATACSSTLMVILTLAFMRFLLAGRSEPRGKKLAVPRGIVVFIALVAGISFLVEGAVMDWSGVFLTEVRSMDMSLAGTGFASFSAAMLLMRLLGDAIVNRVGARRVVLAGSIIAVTGFLIVVFSPAGKFIFLGFFAIGFGCANIVPIFFSLMGRQRDMPLNAAVSSVSTFGYLGVLMGPAAIGFIAHSTSLLASFVLLAVLLAVQLFIGLHVFRKVA